MSSRLKQFFKFFIDVEPHERIKVLLLTISFFMVIGGYTVIKELKDSIFVSTVGREYLPLAKMLSMFVLIPPILFYAKMVDVLRRYQLLYFYCLLYGIGGLLFTYFLGHPLIGLANTESSPYRLFGWFLYFFIEGYNPFVISVFWAFTNSITSPEAAKNNYTIMIAGSKIGGMLMSGLAWWLLSRRLLDGTAFLSDAASHQVLFGLSSTMLVLVPAVLYWLPRLVSAQSLHGYEAAYRIEKVRGKEHEKEGFAGTLKSMFSGLILLVKYPYVLGMFGIVFFWEVINVVFHYLRLGIGQGSTTSVAGLSGFLFEQAFFVHLSGFLIVLFGTRAIINFLGERLSLIFVPSITGVLLIYYLTSQSVTAVLIVYVLIRAVNYAFAYPLRESLYIPTSKETKFKSKSWIDAFGAKVAKGCGSGYNVFSAGFAESTLYSVHMVFFATVIGLWIIVAHLLGRRFERAIERAEVIGSDE